MHSSAQPIFAYALTQKHLNFSVPVKRVSAYMGICATVETMRTYKIAVLPGDGIGPEVMGVCLQLLRQLAGQVGLDFEFETCEAGAACFQRSGVALPESSLAIAEEADAILLAAMGLPSIRHPNGTEVAPQIDLRLHLNLYAGVRPVHCNQRLPIPIKPPAGQDIDFVLIRESTEGLFAAYGKGVQLGDHEARDTMVITRSTCKKLFDFAFSLTARRQQQGRPGRLTCVDKANVFRSLAFFREIFTQHAAAFPQIKHDFAYVDATAYALVKRPWEFDVLVTENMFGDILSDQGAALMGGMGMAPSADIGDHHAVFQPCHGSAPDIAGTDAANPTAMVLSTAMMLEWLAECYNDDDCTHAAEQLRAAVDATFAAGNIPCELGGTAGLEKLGAAFGEHLRRL